MTSKDLQPMVSFNLFVHPKPAQGSYYLTLKDRSKVKTDHMRRSTAHSLGKYCKRFGVTMDLLNSKNFKVAITQLYHVQQV